jgi:hypothetical protein
MLIDFLMFGISELWFLADVCGYVYGKQGQGRFEQ